jgi:hypothetical protein
MLAGLKGFVYQRNLGVLHKSTGGTYIYALAALDTGRIRKAAVLCRGYHGVEAAVFEAQDSQAVCVLAAGYTATAEDTLGGVPYQGRRQLIQISPGVRACKGVVPCSGQLCHMQQLTVFILFALLTVLVMVGQQQLHAFSSCFHGSGGGDTNLHALGYRVYTAGYQTSCACGLYEADAAGAQIALAVVEGAEGRDLIPAALCSLQNSHSLFDFVRDSFDFDVDLSHKSFLLPYYCFEIALMRQVLMQAPHLMHFEVSMV